MAGDWLSASVDLPDRIEVRRMSKTLGMDPEHVCGWLIYGPWRYADRETVDGFLPMSLDDFADTIHKPVAFLHAMISVGWLEQMPDGVRIPRFERWMGNSAKSRLQNTRRQQTSRLSRFSRDKSATRGEERREEIPPNPPTGGEGDDLSGFEDFWTAYPKQVDRLNAERAWRKLRPAPETIAAILSAIQRQRAAGEWTREDGRYIPLPTKYLARRRWEDSVQVKERKAVTNADRQFVAARSRLLNGRDPITQKPFSALTGAERLAMVDLAGKMGLSQHLPQEAMT